MLSYKDQSHPRSPEATRARSSGKNTHKPVEARNTQVKCVVCKLESGEGLGGKGIGQKGLTSKVSTCLDCKVSAHTFVPSDDRKRKIHSLPAFANKTCYEIIHTEEGHSLWERRDHSNGKVPYSTQTSHPIYQHLRQQCGRPTKKQKKDGSSYSSSSTYRTL